VPSLPFGLVPELDAGPRVDDVGFPHDQSVPVQLVDVSTGIRQGDVVDLVGVQPYLPLPALEDARREALLQSEVDCIFGRVKQRRGWGATKETEQKV